MRINGGSSLIGDNSYPLEGMRERDIVRYLTARFEPHAFALAQVQGALYLHNIPLYVLMAVLALAFLLLLKAVADSQFPTTLFLFLAYPIACLFHRTIGGSLIAGACRELPELPASAPDRIRTVEEIAQLAWKPYVCTWRILFFCYRVFVRPNATDIAVFVLFVTLLGVACYVLDGVMILAALVAGFLVLPPLVTRKFVSSFLMARLGGPLIANEESSK